ncbi:chlorinating enzyme [Tistlia consotensis]|uniref:Chlorinating enzyme n=1 Tax=Tistlia consotensis USBA 355 TaxID=560819 RepID=A0A1Y6C628_9PROT|nr:phytanoyl-CoA dioxygenase family protein [Tistlia consotensis]SMF38926.1 chlorinating enzyme [Tistlia consotensis USBA 355]SNR36689.1 chlorinating enzyme [Tistlia consotensis]
MPKVLSPEAIERYRRDGFLFPVETIGSADAAAYRGRLEAFEAEQGKPLQGAYRQKTHLLFTWLNDLIRDPRILDVVEDVLGPNLFCWSSSFFIKEAGDPGYVSWHQDSTYWGLSEPTVMTVWVALSPSNELSGCMKVVPGSHLLDQVAHRDTFNEHNLLTRGQEIAVEVDEKDAAMMPLEPGQASLHHVRLFHASPPNQSNDRRIGYAIRYIPTHVRQVVGEKDSATLVRGKDDYGYFEHEPRPDADFSPEAQALHAAVSERQVQVLYRDTGRSTFRS